MKQIIEFPQERVRDFPRRTIPERVALSSFSEAKALFLLHCRAKNLSKRTVPWYEEKLAYFERFLQQHYPDVDLTALTPALIKDFICEQQRRDNEKVKGRTLSSYTVAGIVRVLKVFFNFLNEEEYLETNPCGKIKVPKIQKKIIKPLSDGEIQKLLSACNPKTFVGFRNYLMLLLFLDAGIRLSELLYLKVGDVDWERYTLRILGKGNKEREVPFGVRVAKSFIKYLKWRGDVSGHDFVFVDTYGQKLKMRNIEKIVKVCGKKAAVENVHCHRFRHTFALNWVKHGGDIFSLQRILGHSTLDMVKNYVNLAGEDIVKKHRQFGWMDRMDWMKK